MGNRDILIDLDYQIILALADNDMKVSLAANDLHYADGTLYYHMNKIKWLTGLDPRKFWDLVKLCKIAKEEYLDGK